MWIMKRITFDILAKDHWRGFNTRNAHIVHIVTYIRFKMMGVYVLVEVSFYTLLFNKENVHVYQNFVIIKRKKNVFIGIQK